MGSVASLCCQCCTKKPRKYNPNNPIETRAASNANYFDHEAENLSKINENTIHVSEIYRSNLDDKNIPSDDPTTSTIFSGMLQQKKDLPPLTNHSAENKNPSLALPVIPLRSRRSASANRHDEFVHPLQKYSNSCSTIYVDDSTVSQPNWKAMIKCVSIAIHSHIVHRKSNKTMAIFDEKLHPLSKDPVPEHYDKQIPEQKTVYRFMRILFTAAQLTAECAIVTLVYLERVLSYGELDLCPSNWKRLVLGAIMLASKVWDDQAVWNVDFCQILKDMTVSQMNELEREYVQLLQFNVNVGSSIYAKYYFDLRELAKENQISFPDQLLTKEKAIKLEASSIVNSNFQSTNPSSQTTPAVLMPVRRSNSTELLYSPRKSLLIIS